MAARLPDSWLDELRSRLNIVDVVADYVALKPKGRRYWGLCPFHNEKTPSFSVDSEAQMYYCFGCHKGGNVIHFVMEAEHMEFLEAVQMLAERAHLEMPERVNAPQEAGQRELREKIYEANVAAAHYFHDLIWTEEGSGVLSYLHKRGLDDAAIRRFGLGAAGHGHDGLVKHLCGQGYDMETLIKAGLCGQKDGRRYDMFRNRAIFPIINAQGRVLGFGGRAMGDAQPKYLNTSDTPVFNKRQGLYALNFVKKERGLKRLILVEGYMDVVSLRQMGVSGVVATLGTALTEEQARLIKRYAPEVWVSYDGDAAGQKAILRALDIFEEQSMPARVLDIPGGMDPDEYIRAHGLEGFQALKPIQPVEYRMKRAADGLDMTSQEGRTRYAIACCELLRSVPNPVELENYLSRLSVETGFEKEVLLSQVGRAQPAAQRLRAPRPRLIEKDEPLADFERAERALLSMMAAQLIPSDLLRVDDFENPLNREIAALLMGGFTPAAALDKLKDDERAQAARILQDAPPVEPGKALAMAEDCMNRMRRHQLEMRIEQAKQQLSQAQGEERKATIALIQRLMQELELAKTGRKE